MSFDIPAGLTDLLQDFTVAVLREKPEPSELVNFAADYFNNLCSNKNFNNVTQSQYNEQYSMGEPLHESMQTESDESDEEPFEPPNIDRLSRRKSVSAEGYDPEADDDEVDDRVIHPKSDEQRKRLSEAVKDILLFRSLDIEQMQEVLDAMFEKKVEPGEHVIDQGDDGDNFYVIDSGTYDIFVQVNSEDKHVGNYNNQGSFGELALMYNMPRAATIVATSDGTLWAMDRSTFRRIVLKNAFNKRKMYESLLEGVPMLKELESYERMNIADALVPQSFTDGQCIIKQGESADCMYFIESGEVRIMMSQKDGDGVQTDEQDSETEVEVTVCKKGQYFGELALLTQKPRAASAYSVGAAKCAVLDVKAFERLLGPCMDILRRNIDNYEEQLVQIFGSKAEISDLR